MNSFKSIILLELLYNQSSSNKEKILNMFMRIVDEMDIYRRLENILNSNIFIGEEASELRNRSNDLLNEVRVNPREAIHLFFKIEELVLILEKKKQESEAALGQLDFFEAKPTVVSKTAAATYTKFYEEFYNAVTYLTVVLYGLDGLADWTKFPMGSFTDLISFTDSLLSEKIKEIKPTKRKWAVAWKNYRGGRAGASYDGCELVYEDDAEFSKIGTDKYPYMRMGGFDSKYIAEGFGFITGVGLFDVTSLFEGELINNVNVGNRYVDPMQIDSNIIYNPAEFLSKVLGTKKFILSPETYVSLLNKYFLNKTIIERKAESKCLLCGRSLGINDKEICANHFDHSQNG